VFDASRRAVVDLLVSSLVKEFLTVQKRAKLHWADGRVTEIGLVEESPLAPTAGEIKITDPDGRLHRFRPTDRVEDGCAVYEEKAE
jgi:hypothetical protein